MRISLRNQYGLAISIFVIGIALAAVGICFLNIGNQAAGITNFVRTWPETSGVILSAEVQKDKPVVRYRYEIEGKSFEGTRVFLSDGPYKSVEALPDGVTIHYLQPNGDAASLSYQKDQTVPVVYNEHVPQESSLNRIVPGKRKKFLFLGVIGIAFGMLFIVRSLQYE